MRTRRKQEQEQEQEQEKEQGQGQAQKLVRVERGVGWGGERKSVAATARRLWQQW